MSRRNSIILGLLFVILVVELIILAPKEIGTNTEPQAIATPIPKGDGFNQVLQIFHTVEAKPHGKEWELWSNRAVQPKNTQEWTIENVRVKFYASNGVTYTVNGAKGHVVPNEKGIRDLRITGNVVTRASNGSVFKSDSIFYDSEKKELHSPSDVEMVSPPDKDGGDLTLTGADMRAEFATNEITVNKNVKAKKKIKGNKTVQIQSERAVFSGRSKLAQFYGKVLITVDTMTVTGPEAKFAYDSNMESLESVIVGGGIKVTDADKFATSQTVNVNFKNDRIVFDGSPRVVQNGDEMTGDRIILSDGGHKVQVSNAKAQIDSKNLEPEKRN